MNEIYKTLSYNRAKFQASNFNICVYVRVWNKAIFDTALKRWISLCWKQYAGIKLLSTRGENPSIFIISWERFVGTMTVLTVLFGSGYIYKLAGMGGPNQLQTKIRTPHCYNDRVKRWSCWGCTHRGYLQLYRIL